MPLRVKSRAGAARDLSPMSHYAFEVEMPDVKQDDSFRDVVKKLSFFFVDAITLPSTFEQLRTTSAGDCLRALVDHLGENCTNPAIVNGLLALKWHYAAEDNSTGLSEARANGCEIVAWRFLTRLSEREAVDYCLYEIPDTKSPDSPTNRGDEESNERSPLLLGGSGSANRRSLPTPGGSSKRYQLLQSISRLTMSLTADDDDEDDDPTAPFKSLNALEIAAIADAKRFLSQHVVQKIITGIWRGDIIFWDTLSVHAEKKPRYYNAATADPFSRLRVPKYLKAWEVIFFAGFLCLYYAVLVRHDLEKISVLEVALYVWFASFCYDELSEWIDAGSIFYAADVWNLFDMIMIGIGIVFAVLRILGTIYGDIEMIQRAFDVLALEALFLVPRICSILSLSPYWGTLIPCLKEMGKDFIKFMVLVVVIYLGFLTTFSLVGRDKFSLGSMAMVLTKIFFGSSYVGFDLMNQIDPVFGPPLMIIFITLSSILLMGSLTGMLSNSFSRVITHAREEYLYVYSVYVLEASTSNRLTHFYPPFNLLALVIFRPLRLVLPSDTKFRAGRIFLLKATHLPIVAAIQAYEWVRGRVINGTTASSTRSDEFAGFKGPRTPSHRRTRSSALVGRPSSAYYAHRPEMPSPRQSDHFIRPSTANNNGRLHNSRDAEDDSMAEPSVVEIRINELTEKIDKLASLVLALQQQNETLQATVTDQKK